MATLKASISGEKHDIGLTTIGNDVKNYKESPTLYQNIINFDPLTAKNRTRVFIYPIYENAAFFCFTAGLSTRTLDN